MKEWLIKEFASSSFHKSSPLAKMSGPPMEIHTDPEARPKVIHKPIPIPHHWHDLVKEKLE